MWLDGEEETLQCMCGELNGVLSCVPNLTQQFLVSELTHQFIKIAQQMPQFRSLLSLNFHLVVFILCIKSDQIVTLGQLFTAQRAIWIGRDLYEHICTKSNV